MILLQIYRRDGAKVFNVGVGWGGGGLIGGGGDWTRHSKLFAHSPEFGSQVESLCFIA